MPNDHDRLALAVERIDAANADDPNSIVVDGRAVPKELVHARLMTAWVERLCPDPGEAQLLAARAHHLRRWELPRRAYPAGRAGYLRWRTEQKKRHARDVAGLLAEVGYDEATIERVQQIIRKDGLGRDPEVQVHEDALCLVFLETQFEAVVDQLGDDKTVDVVRKTLAKMSDAGRSEALGLAMGERERSLVERALRSA